MAVLKIGFPSRLINKIMTKYRAKFQMISVTQFTGQQKIEASPVTSGSEENKSFNKYTPSGKLELMITDDTSAFDALKPGQCFYMDITPIEE